MCIRDSVNTGWNGTGKRISIKDTRGIIDAILNGDINNAPTKTIPYFNFEVPTELNGVDTGILDPRDTYADAAQWEEKAKMCIRDSSEDFISPAFTTAYPISMIANNFAISSINNKLISISSLSSPS